MNSKDFRKRHLNTSRIVITCHKCKKDFILRSWYETKNLIYLCPDCYDKLVKEEK